ncbi:NADPH-dependent FMN reductase [Pseudovibrio axinellae]|uniref:NADPH-dependent FMN reductase n=1 Tax=Pseudovibrio axinellae TaxID=989403 RepID=A0A165T4Q9_9HYPH|nr:NAD(P)H-dependent oxidoreductase [Pseudovibrio axinellae]KZL05424.1 NADPH-dependent FMN reductase [Pseudovibrio axinellae]SEP99830.1 NAD(P)H-dependent FMN reductase [Pseudovibrio axinellae]
MNILLISGSTRKGSLNKSLLEAAAEEAHNLKYSITTLPDELASFPLYHAEIEGDAANQKQLTSLRQHIDAADVILISSPEYNGFHSPHLHNVFTWASRKEAGKTTSVLEGKVVGLLGAAPGPFGGVRMLPRLSSFAGDHGCWVHPRYVAVGNMGSRLNDAGQLTCDETRQKLRNLIGETCRMAEPVQQLEPA